MIGMADFRSVFNCVREKLMADPFLEEMGPHGTVEHRDGTRVHYGGISGILECAKWIIEEILREDGNISVERACDMALDYVYDMCPVGRSKM